jgi:hypothetical protein
MEDKDIIGLWKSYDKKLEENLLLNRQQAEDMTKLKVKSFLASMKPVKWFTILVGMVWVGLGSFLVGNLFMYAFDEVSRFFLFSAAIQLLLTFAAIVIYLYQLALIRGVAIHESVLDAQGKLASLRSSTMWVARILFLQLPLWTTFYWSHAMWEQATVWMYVIHGLITGSFLFAALWLFFNIRYENRDKRWFRLIFSGKEWDPVLRAMELLKQVEAYRV